MGGHRWKQRAGTFSPADNYNCLARADEVLKSATNHSNPHDSQRSLLLFGHGDGGGGPCEEHIQHLSRLRRARGMPSISTTESIATFFQGIEKDFHLPRTLLAPSPLSPMIVRMQPSQTSIRLVGKIQGMMTAQVHPATLIMGRSRTLK